MRLSRDLISDALISPRRSPVFPRFLDEAIDLESAVYEEEARASGCHHAVFSPLYETRKLVKRVIMLNGRAAGSREDPFLLLFLFLSSHSSSRSRVPFLFLGVPLRPAASPGDHTRRIALSLSRFDNTLTRESFRQVIEGR